MDKKRFLFFFVHPAKYHLFKHTINYLKSVGHQVDIAIIAKEMLEDLVKQEGWDYINIFPEGRRSKSTHPLGILLITFANFLKTVWRLYKLTKDKKYDLFVTDDSLVVIGKIKKIPSLMFVEDDLPVVPENGILYYFATKIISPHCTNNSRYENKTIHYKGYHELAYLRPNYFVPDYSVIEKFNPDKKNYFLIRLVSLTASHDRNKKGIDNNGLNRLINLLENKGEVYISSERELPDSYAKYQLRINPADILQVFYYADLFIGDSQTMTKEAAILGTPAIRFNDFVGKLNVLEEEEHKYQLTYGFTTNEFDKMILKIQELIGMEDLKEVFQKRRDVLLNDTIDVVEFLNDLIENYDKCLSN